MEFFAILLLLPKGIKIWLLSSNIVNGQEKGRS
ncbi:hypothetical protein JOC86_004390 [Bacillus pakistanensis]|uniref:Uncharacterized protein n=1 Tax=Rossellomorea pakistanensis TaxID=992288 RepID=A0ABS2NJW0_9BACI|nr:hypothetical protein [Bacillus pakistanensis]